MTVGFIGLGRMGLPMAGALSRAGFSLVVYNRTRERARSLIDKANTDVTVAATPAEVARQARVIVTMLADGEAVDAVMNGADGLLAALTHGTILLEMSTIGPVHARELAKKAAERGASLLDAPVSGSVALAESAALTTLVGGDHQTFEVARSVLSGMTNRQVWLGPSGAGAAMKLGLNGLVAVTNHAIAEALVVAERCGIERVAAYDAILASAVSSAFVSYKRDAFVRPSETPVAFTLRLMVKDLDLYLDLAEDLGVPVVTACAVRDGLRATAAREGEEADLAAVAGALRAAPLGTSTG